MSWPAQRLVRMMEVGGEDQSSHDRELEELISTYWMMMMERRRRVSGLR